MIMKVIKILNAMEMVLRKTLRMKRVTRAIATIIRVLMGWERKELNLALRAWLVVGATMFILPTLRLPRISCGGGWSWS